MPAVTLKGDLFTGHDQCPPCPSVEGEPTVTVRGRELLRVGHAYAAHRCRIHPLHSGVLAAGAAHATLGGLPIGRLGDPVSCGGTVMEGEPSVTVGDAGGADWALDFLAARISDPKDK